ncbi:hypothetical protein FKM82_009358 [Ascaphus truei]
MIAQSKMMSLLQSISIWNYLHCYPERSFFPWFLKPFLRISLKPYPGCAFTFPVLKMGLFLDLCCMFQRHVLIKSLCTAWG